MYGKVVLRSRVTDKGDEATKEKALNESYFARPKSWCEYQSSLKPFRGVHGPRTSSTSDSAKSKEGSKHISSIKPLPIEHTQHDGAIIQKKSIDFLRYSKSNETLTFRKRPVSEVLLPTPFYKAFRTENFQQLSNGESVVNSSKTPETNSDNQSYNPAVVSQFIDEPSVLFEQALNAEETEIDAVVSLTSDSEDDQEQRSSTAVEPTDHAEQKVYYTIPLKNGLPKASTINSSLQQNEAKSSDRFQNLHSETHFKPVVVEENFETLEPEVKIMKDLESSDSAVDAVESNSVADIHFESDASSVIDTGFYSIGEKTDSVITVDITSDPDVNNNEHNASKPSPLQKKARPGIPTPLRSCYNNSYEMNNVGSSRSSSTSITKSSISSSSLNNSDDDSVSEACSVDSNHESTSNSVVARGYEGDRSTEDSVYSRVEDQDKLQSQRLRVSHGNNNTLKRKSKSFQKVADKNSGTDSTDSSFAFKENARFRQTKQDSTLALDLKQRKTKDDQNIPLSSTGRTNPTCDTKNDHGKQIGTWPRRVQRSKRRQDQEEAEELLRRFRETSEIYRTRFRNIYAETRRKIEETMFGLRIAMAKNGYSSKRP